MTTSRSEPATGKPRGPARWLRAIGAVLLLLLAAMAALFVRARSFDNGPLPPRLAVTGDMPVVFADGRRGRLRDAITPGLPTVINLWATWCGPCRMEAPKIASLRKTLGPDKLNLVSLNVRDSTATAADRTAFLRSAGLAPADYVVLDGARDRELTGASDSLIPRTLVFDRAGAPIASVTGYKPLALDRIPGLVR